MPFVDAVAWSLVLFHGTFAACQALSRATPHRSGAIVQAIGCGVLLLCKIRMLVN